MGRPIYPHEMGDPDFFWLISSFRENHPDFSLIEVGSLPMVLIREEKPVAPADTQVAVEAAPPQVDSGTVTEKKA